MVLYVRGKKRNRFLISVAQVREKEKLGSICLTLQQVSSATESVPSPFYDFARRLMVMYVRKHKINL